MHRTGHLGVALFFAAIPTSLLLAVEEVMTAILLTSCIIASCRLPDQAEWAVPGIPHRKVTHNVFFLGAVVTLAVVFAGVAHSVVNPVIQFPIHVYLALPAGVTFGILSHFLADALTMASGKYAVRPFWPVSTWPLRFGITKSKSWIANFGLFAGGAIMYGSCLWIGLQALLAL